ncbi:hypothetical protein DFH06DRAFT_902232, partial [Mycena polygramma]
MIARCRAKCWIIQMRELEDKGYPNIQRGFKGHIIVYPQRPSAIAASLPPSIEDITTPICVVFVGSKPPSLEWIRTKAKPLIVRKEKVMKALDWLSVHNHLYKDVYIDRTVFAGHGDLVHIPFHVEHIIPSDGIEATTSSYAATAAPETVVDNSVPEIPSRNVPDFSAAGLATLLAPVLPGPDVFESVVVTDVSGHESSAKLRKAAADHLKKPGSNYLGIAHDPDPTNEFNNPDLLPLIYPTLFPYGIGGVDDNTRRTPLGFESHLKH